MRPLQEGKACQRTSIMLTAMHLPDLREGEPHERDFVTSTDTCPPT